MRMRAIGKDLFFAEDYMIILTVEEGKQPAVLFFGMPSFIAKEIIELFVI